MSEVLSAPPALSTPAQHIFEDDELLDSSRYLSPISEERLHVSYEISRTIEEIRRGRYKRIALQFPDRLLPDAPRVAAALRDGLRAARSKISGQKKPELNINDLSLQSDGQVEARPYILGDTSYGACCVDEIAAEHINADVVIHYGRACLSPTARLPVIYVFVKQDLDLESVANVFKEQYPEKHQKVMLMADMAFSSYVPKLVELLREQGYTNLYATEIVHDPSSMVPNRTVPEEVANNPASLADWSLFHIGSPPSSLLLLLASRVLSFYIYEPRINSNGSRIPTSQRATAVMMRRRYALLLRAATAPIIGILLNTLSHKSLLPTLAAIQEQIRAAGKKSYTFVVGKINPAKLANFAEIEAWVVVGCWESELVEGDGFWKPMITPWELSVALQNESERTWGQWESQWRKSLNIGPQQSNDHANSTNTPSTAPPSHNNDDNDDFADEGASGDYDSEPESAPPEFDLRTGRYVSHSRPLGPRSSSINGVHEPKSGTSSLVKRSTKTDLASIGGEASPGARYLKEQRTWKGLGSDFTIAYDTREEPSGALMEEGRTGVARAYVNPNTMVKT